MTSASGLDIDIDIDHMVPLAEAWDSGASTWSPQRREAYANDQGAEASLVAVTARSNRSKADQDPVGGVAAGVGGEGVGGIVPARRTVEGHVAAGEPRTTCTADM